MWAVLPRAHASAIGHEGGDLRTHRNPSPLILTWAVVLLCKCTHVFHALSYICDPLHSQNRKHPTWTMHSSLSFLVAHPSGPGGSRRGCRWDPAVSRLGGRTQVFFPGAAPALVSISTGLCSCVPQPRQAPLLLTVTFLCFAGARGPRLQSQLWEVH